MEILGAPNQGTKQVWIVFWQKSLFQFIFVIVHIFYLEQWYFAQWRWPRQKIGYFSCCSTTVHAKWRHWLYDNAIIFLMAKYHLSFIYFKLFVSLFFCIIRSILRCKVEILHLDVRDVKIDCFLTDSFRLPYYLNYNNYFMCFTWNYDFQVPSINW